MLVWRKVTNYSHLQTEINSEHTPYSLTRVKFHLHQVLLNKQLRGLKEAYDYNRKQEV